MNPRRKLGSETGRLLVTVAVRPEYGEAWRADPGLPSADPKPTRLPHNRHRVRRVVEGVAAESQPGTNPCGPEHETARADPVWLFPDTGEGQPEWRPQRDGP